ncbi:MAG: ABC transporter ATP-binding protein [Deltaproteobacteria bacterium]|nr:MAG: ABC transporter ATP-binding protein [Deltaproteobacteria bacterium]
MASEHLMDEDYQGRFDSQVWRRLLTHAAPYKRQLLGLTVSGAYLAGVETLIPYMTGQMIDEASRSGLTQSLYTYGGFYLGLQVTFAFAIWMFIMWAGQTATGVGYDLRKAGFQRLQELSFSYYDTRSTGWLVSRLTSDSSKLSNLLPWFLLDLVWGSLLILGITTAMLWLHWKLALVVMTIIPMLVGASVYFQKKLLSSSRRIRKTNSLLTSSFTEAVMGVRTSKALVREEANTEEFQDLSTDMYTYTVRNALQSAVYLPLITSIGSIGVGLALSVGGAGIAKTGAMGLSFGQLITFMQYATLLYMPIQEMARRFTELQSAQAAAERIQDLLDTEPAIADSPDVQRAIEAYAKVEQQDGLAMDGKPHTISDVTFDNVSFAYKKDETVLQSFNLHVKTGQTIALVGATGSGKSTIVNLLARFYEPTEGTVQVNGEDYKNRSLHWYQSQLGVMLQKPHLFRGSIQENIRYGRLDATDEEIEEAAKKVNAHSFIRKLADGYKTDVGEAGGNLSTGQRQLIALARALLADPQIVIMDEATSSIDTETERIIQEAIDKVLSDRIAFVIAHRLSTIRSADTILVIQKGHVIERGSHRQLMQRKGHYYKLYTRQFVQESHPTNLLTPATTPES